MKRIFFTYLVFMTVIGSAQSSWVLKDYVDDFGDKTSKQYISVIDKGMFSNSATKNSELITKIFISYNKNVSFDMYEYGRGQSVGKAIGKAEYILSIKLNYGQVQTFNLWAGENTLYLEDYDSDRFIAICNNYVKQNGNITDEKLKCVIKIDGEYSSEVYNFCIPLTNFTITYNKLFGIEYLPSKMPSNKMMYLINDSTQLKPSFPSNTSGSSK